MFKSGRAVRVYLEEILDSINDIQSYTKGVTKAAFFADKKTQDAVIRKIEVIGEIVKRLPPVITKQDPQIPWRDIAGMRDILIHEYATVDLHETWVVVKIDISKLKRSVKKIVKQIDEKE